jgi:hypothetical protein
LKVTIFNIQMLAANAAPGGGPRVQPPNARQYRLA